MAKPQLKRLYITYHKEQKVGGKTQHNKMHGMISISTYMGVNHFCQMMQKTKSNICAQCYVPGTLRYENSRSPFIENGDILRSKLYSDKEIYMMIGPVNATYARFEAFGEVEKEEYGGVTQARNYIRIAKAYKDTKWAAYSKNIKVWEKAFEQEKKPSNLTFVYSVPKICGDAPEGLPKFVDHVFIVHNCESEAISCGHKYCLQCHICYTKRKPFVVNELTKALQSVQSRKTNQTNKK